MHNIQSLSSLAIVALSTIASASTFTGVISGSPCPSDWSNIQYKDIQRCCYGSLDIESNEPYCCVHDFKGFNNPVPELTSGCFPFCTGTTRDISSVTQDLGKSCQTKIAFTTDDYSSLVSAASASITGTKRPSNSDATTTGSGSGTSGSETTNTATAKSSETSTNMAGPITTAESMALKGAAIAAALFAL